MIDFIHLINIQNHQDTYIDLHKGFTTITGKTDSGKTVIRMALESVVYRSPMELHYNETKGCIKIGKDGQVVERHLEEEFERKKCPKCKVKLTEMKQFCECGERLKRKKVDDYYIINNLRTKNTGVEVPQEVVEFFNMGKVSISDKQEVSLNNFPKKKVTSIVDLDPPERMNIIGSIGTDLVILENKTKNNNKIIKDTKEGIKLSIKNQKFYQKELKKLEPLEEIEPLVNRYKVIKKEIENINNKVINLKQLIQESLELELKINIYKSIKEKKSFNIELNKILNISNIIHQQKLLPEKIKIYKCLDSIKLFELDSNMINIHSLIKKLTEMKVIKVEFPDEFEIGKEVELNQLIQSYQTNKELEKTYDFTIDKVDLDKDIAVLNLINEYNINKIQVNQLLDDIYDVEELVNENQNKLNSIEVCPLCLGKGDFCHES